ncbi:MAG: polysaccharide deacetylase family protein [Solirubrobacteraceae bacterium]
MDDRATTPDQVRPRPSGPRRGASTLPHHRRRRALALVLLGACALIVGILAVGGSGTARHHVTLATVGFMHRIQTLAGTGLGSFSAAEQAAENAAIDRTLAYAPYVRLAGAQHRELALTFDDGPGPYTPKILSILERAGVPATFFEVGVLERYFHASTAEIVADGYPVGDHTESHAPMSKLSAADQERQLLLQSSHVGDYGVPFPRLFRPPYGLWNSTTLSLLHRYKMLMVLWSVDTGDYRGPGESAIVSSVLHGARPGAIVLMHDAGGDRGETVQALPRIITALRARGYRLVTVPRLLLDNPPPVNQQLPGGLGGTGG